MSKKIGLDEVGRRISSIWYEQGCCVAKNLLTRRFVHEGFEACGRSSLHSSRTMRPKPRASGRLGRGAPPVQSSSAAGASDACRTPGLRRPKAVSEHFSRVLVDPRTIATHRCLTVGVAAQQPCRMHPMQRPVIATNSSRIRPFSTRLDILCRLAKGDVNSLRHHNQSRHRCPRTPLPSRSTLREATTQHSELFLARQCGYLHIVSATLGR